MDSDSQRQHHGRTFPSCVRRTGTVCAGVASTVEENKIDSISETPRGHERAVWHASRLIVRNNAKWGPAYENGISLHTGLSRRRRGCCEVRMIRLKNEVEHLRGTDYGTQICQRTNQKVCRLFGLPMENSYNDYFRRLYGLEVWLLNKLDISSVFF